MRVSRMGCWVGVVLAACACSGQTDPLGWMATGDRAAFPSPLTVDKATAIDIDGTYCYWVTTDGFLYHAPRTGGDVARVRLPAPGTILTVHNDVFVGWTDGSGNAAIADIDPATGKVAAMIHQPGALLELVAGQRGYSYAVSAPGGTRVQACRDGVCTALIDIPSEFKSLANDFPTKTFYVLTADGLRACSLDVGCPTQATPTPAATTFVADLPGTYFLLDSSGQNFGKDGAKLGSAAVPSPTSWEVVDGNGYIATWSNGTHMAQCSLAPGTTTTELALACTDFDTDASGRPIYCLVGSSNIQVIP